jgi:hypothetical protein
MIDPYPGAINQALRLSRLGPAWRRVFDRRTAPLKADTDMLAQRFSSPRQSRSDSSNRYVQDGGNLFVAHALQTDKQDG